MPRSTPLPPRPQGWFPSHKERVSTRAPRDFAAARCRPRDFAAGRARPRALAYYLIEHDCAVRRVDDLIAFLEKEDEINVEDKKTKNNSAEKDSFKEEIKESQDVKSLKFFK